MSTQEIKVKSFSQLEDELKRALNAESYYAYKFEKWREIGRDNRVRNVSLSKAYLELETLCEWLKAKLVKYEAIIFVNENSKSLKPRFRKRLG